MSDCVHMATARIPDLLFLELEFSAHCLGMEFIWVWSSSKEPSPVNLVWTHWEADASSLSAATRGLCSWLQLACITLKYFFVIQISLLRGSVSSHDDEKTEASAATVGRAGDTALGPPSGPSPSYPITSNSSPVSTFWGLQLSQLGELSFVQKTG